MVAHCFHGHEHIATLDMGAGIAHDGVRLFFNDGIDMDVIVKTELYLFEFRIGYDLCYQYAGAEEDQYADD